MDIPPPQEKSFNKLIYHKRRFKCYESNLEKSNDSNIVLLDEGLGSINSSKGLGGGIGLLLQTGNDGFGGTTTIVFRSL